MSQVQKAMKDKIGFAGKTKENVKMHTLQRNKYVNVHGFRSNL